MCRSRGSVVCSDTEKALGVSRSTAILLLRELTEKKEKPKICDIMRKNKRAVKIISLRYGFYADAEPMNLRNRITVYRLCFIFSS